MIRFEGREIPMELREVADPRHSVLLVWDMQNDQAGGSFNKEQLIRNASPLIGAARDCVGTYAEERHLAALKRMERFADVAESNKLIEIWSANR